MKKVILFFGVAVLAIILSGCGKKEAAKETETGGPSKTGQQGKQLQSEDSTGPDASPENKPEITSQEALKKAIASGEKLECAYEFKGENNTIQEVKGYIDGKKYKSSFEAGAEKYTVVMDGETMYSWSENTKQGTKMSITCMEQAFKDLPQAQEQQKLKTSDEMVEDMMNIHCKGVSIIDFSIPSDVTFMDTCEQMKGSMQQIRQLQEGNIPTNIPTPVVSE